MTRTRTSSFFFSNSSYAVAGCFFDIGQSLWCVRTQQGGPRPNDFLFFSILRTPYPGFFVLLVSAIPMTQRTEGSEDENTNYIWIIELTTGHHTDCITPSAREMVWALTAATNSSIMTSSKRAAFFSSVAVTASPAVAAGVSSLNLRSFTVNFRIVLDKRVDRRDEHVVRWWYIESTIYCAEYSPEICYSFKYRQSNGWKISSMVQERFFFSSQIFRIGEKFKNW